MLFCNNLPLEKGVALHLNKLESPPLMDALCQVWLKLAHWFWRRRWKYEKITDRQTDGRTDDGQKVIRKSHLSFQLRWAKNSRMSLEFWLDWWLFWKDCEFGKPFLLPLNLRKSLLGYLVFHHSLHWNEWQFCDDVTVDFAFDNLLVLKNLVDMNLIFFRLIEVWTKKGRKTASMRVANCCKSFPFFFRLIPRSTEKILDLFLII